MRKVLGIGINDMRGKWCCNRTNSKNSQEFLEARIYSLWVDMLNRCYSTSYHSHLTYQNVLVCSRWRRFSNFIKDISNLPNYSLWVSNQTVYELDKEYFRPSKVYCLKTCGFNTKYNNICERNARCGNPGCFQKGKRVRAINVLDSNDVRYYSNAKEALNDGFSNSSIGKCCKGKQKTHKGYYWSYV